jgi:ABC-type antimicrobial peptide transport system permease subunit
VRSALVGSVFAVALMVTTVTFASGLSTLISHPALYGWNWNYMLNPSNTVPPHSLAQLSDDPDVAAWSGATLANAQFDGQTIPILLTNPRAKVAPPILTGHGLDAKNQVVLGAASLALLHKKVGDTVTVTYGSPKDAPIYIPPTNLTIVGTATFPAVGFTSFIADHTSMGNGALVANGTETAAMQKAIKSPDPNLNGPEMAFVRLKPGVSDAAGRANLQKIAEGADKILADDPHAVGNTVKVLGVIRPAQIVNYHSIGSTPIILALGLAGGAIVALGLTLVASVRRRRRELALLKTLGFSQRQLAAAVAWQATIAAAIGIIFGIPIGIASGRALWTLFARNINAVPDPTVPLLSVVIIAASTLIFANLVALLPGRIAARTSTAMVLRAE